MGKLPYTPTTSCHGPRGATAPATLSRFSFEVLELQGCRLGLSGLMKITNWEQIDTDSVKQNQSYQLEIDTE